MSRKEGGGDLSLLEFVFSWVTQLKFYKPGIHAMTLSLVAQLHHGWSRNWGANPHISHAAKEVLISVWIPRENGKAIQWEVNKNRPNTIGGVVLGRHTTCTETHQDWLSVPRWEMDRTFKTLSAVQTQGKPIRNADVFLYRRSNRDRETPWVFIPIHKLLVLGPFSKRTSSLRSLLVALWLSEFHLTSIHL